MLDDKFVYVFIRQDLAIELQLVHIAHAAMQMIKQFSMLSAGIPSVVVIGVPDEKAIGRVKGKLTANFLDHHSFDDPDRSFGVTSIATVPLDLVQKQLLSNYRLWNAVHNLSLADGAISTQTGKPWKDYSNLSNEKK